MSTIKNNEVVTINYTLIDTEDNSILDSSDENGSLPYLHGSQFLMPGLESALSGKAIGDKVDLTLKGDQAYGDFKNDLVFTINRNEFPDDIALEVGLEFEAEIKDELRYCTITQIENDLVTINANHPLSGKTLRVQAEVIAIRKATPEEIEHGHVHEDDQDCEE
jgi:FKBP-type peptidyl-prolyl cis-trans isomerase SlyD